MLFDVIFHSNDQINKTFFRSADQLLEVEFQCFQKITVQEPVEHYEGSYDVTPLITSQILPTNQKFMDDNVRIDMIPTREIQNPSGGITFIVG